MKRLYILLVCILSTINVFANVDFIDLSKITNNSKLITAFTYIKRNQKFYDHWTHNWDYETPKEDFIKNLSDDYSMFSSLTNKNEELYLLLGDIANYLYNLDDTLYYRKAVENYNLAIKTNSKDYRSYWFLGNHYAFSNNSVKAIDNYFMAESLLSAEAPADFWNGYAGAAAMANMPSHCFFAMDKVKSITGREGIFEAHLGEAIHKRMINIDKDSSYSRDKIWSESAGEKVTFVSRPLGIKLLIDSTWKMGVFDYTDHKSKFFVKPLGIKNKDGMDVTYTIGIIMETANDTDRLENYINKFVPKSSNRTKITFSQKYDKIIAYEITDKTMYQNVGGVHAYMIAIEREAPKYPGLLLESPATIPHSNSGQMQVYRAEGSRKRFDGKIFYLIMLDSCEDIHEQSYSIFKTFFDNQLIIE